MLCDEKFIAPCRVESTTLKNLSSANEDVRNLKSSKYFTASLEVSEIASRQHKMF